MEKEKFMLNNIALVGYGYVGKSMERMFNEHPDYKVVPYSRHIGTKEEVNKCDLAIVCVPTPKSADGSCDTSAVEEVISWIECPLILIKSAVEPGTTERLKAKYGKRIVTSPEYAGESKFWTPPRYPNPTNPISHGFFILGGDDQDCSDVADILIPVVGPATRIRFMTAQEAELVKYFENTWGATKVTLANEFRKICEAAGANWHRVREGWIDDPRVEPMHTAVFKNKRGFGGKCFPKDISALVFYARKKGYEPIMISSMIESNEKMVHE